MYSNVKRNSKYIKHLSTFIQSEYGINPITLTPAKRGLDNPLLAPPERDAWVMCSRNWAREAFQNALRQNGITYALQPQRLAFYCYDFFFFYLTAFLDTFAQTDTVEEYLDGWIKDSFEYADKLCDISLGDKQ